jgi:hypothetical protein
MSYQLFAAVVATSESKFDYKKLASVMGGPGEQNWMATLLYHFS